MHHVERERAVARIHPVAAQMEPSPEQEPAIVARGRDVVVTAGAGTGKTRTLVARYLSLTADGLPLRSIAAVTFTRKAAREMRNRVREEIRSYLLRLEADETERQRWLGLYTALDAARIGTIHGLCTEILRAHPAEAHVDPRFQVLEEGQANILLHRAVAEALAWAADRASLVGLFALLGEETLRTTLASMVSRRLDVEACLANLAWPLWPAWEARLLDPVRAFVGCPAVRDAFASLFAIRDCGALARAEAAGDMLAAPMRRLIARWDEITDCCARDDWSGIVAHLPALRSDMSRYGRASNWQPNDPKPAIANLRALYDADLKEWLGKGLDLAREQSLAEAVPTLRTLFVHACASYQRGKDERQALDYDDLEAKALTLLRENPAVRARWQREISALLVDEFQDTNERQRDLVALINGGQGRLFMVGDAKQSIYRFRGADVVVFRRERARIDQDGGASLALETSYRAHRDLIAALNTLLRPVMGDQPDPTRPWAEPFAPLRPYRSEAGQGFAPPFVELHLALGSKARGALDRAAQALAARLQDLMIRGCKIEKDGRSRPLQYGDLAILCRASTSFAAYEDALERAGIPFMTVAGRGFYGRPEVRDLLNALQALADPTDDLALAGLLRSPACCLSDDGLFRLCQERDARRKSLWETVGQREVRSALSETDGRCVQRAASLISRLHDQVGRTALADVLKDLLDTTGYRTALMLAGQSRAARNVAKLLADAHASGIVGVGEFLEYVTGLRESGVREGEARATGEGAVQIMTVHAAKGLEFPVVVIGDVTREAGGARGLLLDPELGPLVPTRDEQRQMPAIYRLGKATEDDQEAAESDRLLYVAATRAREMLIVSGYVSVKRDNTLGKLGGWLGRLSGEAGLPLADMEVAWDTDGARAHHLELMVSSVPVSCTLYEPQYTTPASLRPRERAPGVDPPTPPPLLQPVCHIKQRLDEGVRRQERQPIQRVWRVVPNVRRAEAPAWVVGSLVHGALASWRFPNGDAHADEARSFVRWANARARSLGLTDGHQLAHAASQTQQILLRFQSHALYREMDGAARRLHEVPYSLTVDGTIESGLIDALYQKDGSWTLVEFKTDHLRDRAALERLLDETDYLAQTARYVAATERLLGERPHVVLCLLSFAGSVLAYQPDQRAD